jgi:hypothetical protein
VDISRFGSLTDLALREALRHYQLRPEKDQQTAENFAVALRSQHRSPLLGHSVPPVHREQPGHERATSKA